MKKYKCELHVWNMTDEDEHYRTYRIQIDEALAVELLLRYSDSQHAIWSGDAYVYFKPHRKYVDSCPVLFPDWAGSEEERIRREDEIVETTKQKALEFAKQWLEKKISTYSSSLQHFNLMITTNSKMIRRL